MGLMSLALRRVDHGAKVLDVRLNLGRYSLADLSGLEDIIVAENYSLLSLLPKAYVVPHLPTEFGEWLLLELAAGG